MSDQDIIQNLISELGQSQDERLPRELGAHHADVDERTPEQLMMFARRFSRFVNYYRGNTAAASGNWESFFPHDEAEAAALLASEQGDTPAHLALWASFLKLYELPREALNGITGLHMDFFYRSVLRFEKQGAVPDRAHVLLELKKNTAPVRVGPEHRFLGGKDASGAELVYAPVRDTVVSRGKVTSLRSVFVDSAGQGTVRFAPIANSLDGLGAELQGDEPKWPGFGGQALPSAELGFALASPVLRMAEGRRKVSLTLKLGGLPQSRLNSALGTSSLHAYVTGQKSWVGPLPLTASLASDTLRLDFEVPASEQSIVDYDEKVHGYAYTAASPVVQVFLKAGAALGYEDVKDLDVKDARVSVDVSGITSLQLESDAGRLDPKKAFLPFGSQPAVGSRLMVGYPEALTKKLSEVKLELQWQGLPGSFSSHYANYGVTGLDDDYFTVSTSFQDAGTWAQRSQGHALFTPLSTTGERELTFTPGSTSNSRPLWSGYKVYALQTAGNLWARRAAQSYVRRSPVYRSFLTAIPDARPGFITLSLEQDFKHTLYRTKSIAYALKYSKSGSGEPTVLQEPYTPTLQSISLSYKAHSDTVSIQSRELEDFSNPDVHFFLIGAFGQMREHGYQRQQFGFVPDKSVPLFPRYLDEGELLVGLSGLQANDSVSVLFQVAEGSADPELKRQPLRWSVLCDNYWKTLGQGEVVLDTTHHLLTSGTVTFVIPREATVQNTVLPGGLVWLKASVARDTGAVSQLIRVAANAVEVRLQEAGAHPSHLSTPLPEGKIGKLKTPVAAVKSINQPFASFGGRPEESDEALRTRAAERLRHRGRCLTAWDYERLVLGHFPGVYHAKCIPHAKDGSWLAPGHALVVVIPDLRNKNARDPLEPKVDADTLSRIDGFLRAHTGMQVQARAKNPRYQRIQLDFKVKLHPGFEFNFYSKLLEQELIQFLSPWAFSADRRLSFGGHVYKSVLLDFVEEREYVDFVTDFKMYSHTGGGSGSQDVQEAHPQTPDALLVSAPMHLIKDAEA
ncbi:baseplate J/gp47 family protein [Myxococcus landrumensis]|uniref:Baseplate J/gp47 family protein n=1 Tax=Myxococcus landrumensis TaxID=2813577 RepID=A0ABX7N888_9BACT|nr:baseplate J/gp47 family protein [Myxococcus landrumus]QSQ13867.1 baseplate J/gp47 family protein [Myxococcus landrumus]